MTKRSLTWIRQHTNVEDLLDDGIDNNSDLKSFAIDGNALEEAPVSPTIRKEAQRSEAPIAKPAPISFLGIIIGSLMIAFGTKLFLSPVDMFVYRDRGKYFNLDFIEHVTHGRSEIYGAAGFFLGIAVLIYSVYKARK